MRDNEKPTTTISLYSLICEFLASEGHRTLTLAEYQKTLGLICNPASPGDDSNTEAVEYLIKYSTIKLRWVLPSGSLRNFVNNFKEGRQIYLSRQQRMDYQTAKDIITLICQQPPAFR
jgi:hypothetical protein